ncbi:MAG TPA: hypothetical protein VK718_07575 [Ferruginibacter sp.]|jgi:hypothetical protein|nr:hypothetical protein [Ferruginibacter sp.]
MKRLLLFILLLISGKVFSQASDFILLQKHKQTIASFYKGNEISFVTIAGAAIDAQITAIRNDTIFLAQYIVQQVPTTAGVNMLDTLGSYPYQFNYRDIKSINLGGRHFNFSASGASLFGGGILLAVGSGVVYLADRKDFSPLLLIAGAALATVGYFLSRNSSDGTTIGRKYKLAYIDVTSDKKP